MRYVIYKMVVLVFAMGLSSTTVFAAGNGSSPNGKPFVEINGQILEVKSDISSLQDAHDAIVARVEALEDADFQDQIDFLTAEIDRLDAENGLRVDEIQELIVIAAQNGFDVALALSEIQRLEGLIDDLSADQTALIGDFQDQIDALEADIATNASGLLGVIANTAGNTSLIGLLETDITQIEGNVAALTAELAGKQDDIIAACPANQFVIDVQDNGTLICGEAQVSAGATLTVATVFPSFSDLDNNDTSFTHNHCFFLGFDVGLPPPCGTIESLGSVTHSSFSSGDKFLSAFCPTGFLMTGGGFDTGSQNDIIVEDSRPSSSSSSGNGWTVFFDNRSSGVTSGRLGRATVRCIQII